MLSTGLGGGVGGNPDHYKHYVKACRRCQYERKAVASAIPETLKIALKEFQEYSVESMIHDATVVDGGKYIDYKNSGR